MRAMLDRTGSRYGMLVVRDEVAPSRQYGNSQRNWRCVCDCGQEVEKGGRYLVTSALPNCGCEGRRRRLGNLERSRGHRLVDLTGKRFGSWLVLERGTSSRSGMTRWRCVCDLCGAERLVLGGHLQKGNSRSCGCTNGARLHRSKFQGVGMLHKSVYTAIKTRAGGYGGRSPIDFSVSIEYLWALFEEQGGKCAISGIPLQFPPTLSPDDRRLQTASLDRIDNTLGYVAGNVQWVHKHINMMKRDLAQSYFIQLCKVVAANNEGCQL